MKIEIDWLEWGKVGRRRPFLLPSIGNRVMVGIQTDELERGPCIHTDFTLSCYDLIP